MLEENIYISSDGTRKDVTTLDYQYLVNAMAKAYRNLNEVEIYSDWMKNNNNINAISKELLSRNKKYYDNHFGGNK